MRRQRAGIAVGVLAAAGVLVATPLMASSPGTWRGIATGVGETHGYGRVSFRVEGQVVRDLAIAGVRGRDCPAGVSALVIPSARIVNGRFAAQVRPVPGVDWTITVRGTIGRATAQGTAVAGPVCRGTVRFAARLS